MKYLKHFANAQDAEDYIDKFDGDYNFLASVEGSSVVSIIQGGGASGLTVQFFRGGDTPVLVCSYPYDSDTVINTMLSDIFQEHPDVQSYYDVFKSSDIGNGLNKNNTFAENGVNNGDTLICVEASTQ